MGIEWPDDEGGGGLWANKLCSYMTFECARVCVCVSIHSIWHTYVQTLMHTKNVSNSPIWHLSWRYKEPTPKPRHSTQHWRNSMGIVRSRGDDKDQHGHPCLVEGDTEHSRLKKHPETVLIIGDGLQSIIMCTVWTFKFGDLYHIGYNCMVSDRRFKRQQLLDR